MPATPALFSADSSLPAGLLQTVLDVSLTGIQLWRPHYEPGGELVDFVLDYLNPAGQRMLGLPEPVGKPMLTHFPHPQATGILDFYRRTFETGEAGRYDFNYQHDGFDSYFHLAAQRHESLLVVSFTDPVAHGHNGVEQAPRESQGREQATRAGSEDHRQRQYEVLMQLPANVATHHGADHTFEFVNPRYQQLFPARAIQGRPVREALPDLTRQDFFQALDQVYQTGEPFYGSEMETWADFTQTGRLDQVYANVFFQALYDTQGRINGILNFSYDVTEQVLARQQVQQLNQELATANEELHAANEEIQASIAELQLSEQALLELNHDLETRVTARTQELQEAQAEAERQRDYLQAVFEQAPVSVGVFAGPDYLIDVCNPGLQAIWGRTAAQVLHRSLFEVLPEIRDQGFKKLLDEVVRTGVPHVTREVPLLVQQQGQLTTVHLNFVYHPLRDAQDQITAVAAVATDVSEQVAARQQVQQLNTALTATNAALTATNEELDIINQQLTRTNVDLDTFVYTASHDLKAPITNIEGLLQTLLEELPAESQIGEIPYILNLMHDSVDRFKRTIEHLTEVSRLQKEHGKPASEVSLADVIRDVRLDLAPLIGEVSAQLDVNVEACPALIFSEKNLRSVVYNLLSNALKYHHPDRVPQVRIHCRPEQDYWVLEVQDNGLGLSTTPERPLFTMFERFHTHVEGSGVGLYMVKKMVENAGGHIEVQSQVEVGSTFTVYFKR